MSEELKVRLVWADVLRIQPGEKLLIRVPGHWLPEWVEALSKSLRDFGLERHQFFVLAGDDVQFTVFEDDQ